MGTDTQLSQVPPDICFCPSPMLKKGFWTGDSSPSPGVTFEGNRVGQARGGQGGGAEFTNSGVLLVTSGP